MRFAHFFITLLLISGPALAATSIDCGHRYAQVSGHAPVDEERLAQIKTQLDRDIANETQALKRLELKPGPIELIDFLGDGDSGAVYRVKYNGKEYALKMFRRNNYYQGEKDTLFMQKHLGDLGLAPKVEGILPEAKIQDFFRQNRMGMSARLDEKAEDFHYGLMMEVVEGVAYKRLEMDQLITTTPAERERLLADADKLVSTLHQLKIRPVDLDLVVTTDKQLKVIDLTYYDREDYPLAPMQRQFRQITDGILNSAAAPP